MKPPSGQISARLGDASDEKTSCNLIDLINKNINPPDAIKETDVYIRAMYIVSDEINSFGGRFPNDEMEHLAELMVDSPVMVGHRKDRLPIGRNFHAKIEMRKGKTWVKSYFYWLKNARGAETLKENIDGGIYKECSIGFTYLFPECSICGKDIRTCEHEPLRQYPVAGNDEITCYFNYRQIERVLETSLVYRGAVPDTSVSKELTEGLKTSPKECMDIIPLTDLKNLDPKASFIAVPCYESVGVWASCENGQIKVSRVSGAPVTDKIDLLFKLGKNVNWEKAFGFLVGYRGKERCAVGQLERYLAGLSSGISRLEIKLFPDKKLLDIPFDSMEGHNRIVLIRHVISDLKGLSKSLSNLKTRLGVYIWPVGDRYDIKNAYHYHPDTKRKTIQDCYRLEQNPFKREAILNIRISGHCCIFGIKQFNPQRLLHGGRFIADRIDKKREEINHNYDEEPQNRLTLLKKSDGGLSMELSGCLSGHFIVRPVKINDRKRYLFYRVAS